MALVTISNFRLNMQLSIVSVYFFVEIDQFQLAPSTHTTTPSFNPPSFFMNSRNVNRRSAYVYTKIAPTGFTCISIKTDLRSLTCGSLRTRCGRWGGNYIFWFSLPLPFALPVYLLRLDEITGRTDLWPNCARIMCTRQSLHSKQRYFFFYNVIDEFWRKMASFAGFR